MTNKELAERINVKHTSIMKAREAGYLDFERPDKELILQAYAYFGSTELREANPPSVKIIEAIEKKRGIRSLEDKTKETAEVIDIELEEEEEEDNNNVKILSQGLTEIEELFLKKAVTLNELKGQMQAVKLEREKLELAVRRGEFFNKKSIENIIKLTIGEFKKSLEHLSMRDIKKIIQTCEGDDTSETVILNVKQALRDFLHNILKKLQNDLENYEKVK